MCVVLIGSQEEGHCNQRLTYQHPLCLQASMIMLPNGEKEASKMCVVLIGCHQEGPWHQKHAQYIDGPEQLRSLWCKNTHRTQCLTHQRSPRLQASMIMFPDSEKKSSTRCVFTSTGGYLENLCTTGTMDLGLRG